MSPLNAAWRGELRQPAKLPQMGHLLLIFPLGETAFACAGVTIEPSQYIFLAPTTSRQPINLQAISPKMAPSQALVLFLSPPFMTDMARFLGIPDDVQQLLHGLPLHQGDAVSAAASELADACHVDPDLHTADDLFLEVVGEVLRLMRVRHDALQRMLKHKDGTVADVLPRLLLARQFVEARCTEEFKTKDVAEQVGLSEFHFARLFRTAFDISPRQYVIHLRLDAARRLLELPENTVTETALRVGYGSLSSFIHAFSKRFRLSPAQYRAQFEK